MDDGIFSSLRDGSGDGKPHRLNAESQRGQCQAYDIPFRDHGCMKSWIWYSSLASSFERSASRILALDVTLMMTLAIVIVLARFAAAVMGLWGFALVVPAMVIAGGCIFGPRAVARPEAEIELLTREDADVDELAALLIPALRANERTVRLKRRAMTALLWFSFLEAAVIIAKALWPRA